MSLAGVSNKNITKNEALVTCPVLKTKIKPAEASDTTVYKGKKYYFCCAGCKPLFIKNPEKYLNQK